MCCSEAGGFFMESALCVEAGSFFMESALCVAVRLEAFSWKAPYVLRLEARKGKALARRGISTGCFEAMLMIKACRKRMLRWCSLMI